MISISWGVAGANVRANVQAHSGVPFKTPAELRCSGFLAQFFAACCIPAAQ